jgi:hypothetical protein
MSNPIMSKGTTTKISISTTGGRLEEGGALVFPFLLIFSLCLLLYA